MKLRVSTLEEREQYCNLSKTRKEESWKWAFEVTSKAGKGSSRNWGPSFGSPKVAGGREMVTK